MLPEKVSELTKFENVIMTGDLSKLTPDERGAYVSSVCNSLGLNPLTRPFEYITLNGKLTLYAKRDATDQLRSIKNISVEITDRQVLNDVYVVTAKATDPKGRADTSIGAVSIRGLNGDALANAFMKAETKSKRRVTLSICGLGLLDETEVETIVPKKESVYVGEMQQPIAKKALPSDLGEYVCAIGNKINGQKLRDVPVEKLAGYIDWINRQQKPAPSFKEFANVASQYLEQVYANQQTDDDSFPFETESKE